MKPPASPEFVYKYRSLSAPDRDRTLFSLKHGSLWFSLRTGFKDRNDCNIPVSYDATPESFRRKGEAALAAVYPGISEANRDAMIEKAIKDRAFADPDRIESVRVGNEERVKQRGILSLTSECDSEHMWCEYADAHRGCCLQFKTGSTGMFANVEKADYVAKLPKPNYYDMPHDELVNTIMLTKKAKYRAENEWRIWHPNGCGNYLFPKKAFTGLIFGHSMRDSDKQLLADCLQRLYPAVKLYQAFKESSGNLKITPIT